MPAALIPLAEPTAPFDLDFHDEDDGDEIDRWLVVARYRTGGPHPSSSRSSRRSGPRPSAEQRRE